MSNKKVLKKWTYIYFSIFPIIITYEIVSKKYSSRRTLTILDLDYPEVFFLFASLVLLVLKILGKDFPKISKMLF